MDLRKSYEFFQPNKDTTVIHIIGCGSVGSTIAENLARCGVTKMYLWDFDKVEAHNIVNQMFRHKDIGKKKTDALKEILLDINPSIGKTLTLKEDGWQGEVLTGYVFLCVDNIDLRREIVEANYDNSYVKAMFDVRTRMTDAQMYAADWFNLDMKKSLLKSMQFTHEEAMAETPVGACGSTLGIATTVRLICGLCVNNYIKLVKKEPIWKFCQIDGFKGIIDCFE